MSEVVAKEGLCIEEVYFGDEVGPSGPSTQSLRFRLATNNGRIEVDASSCDIWQGNTRDCDALRTSASYEKLRDSIRLIGQQVPVIARLSPTSPERLEVIVGASRLTAIREIGVDQKGEPLLVWVDIRDVDGDGAFRLVTGENVGRSGLSPIEQARLYRYAIDTHYKTAEALAEALGLNKSTVGRTLHVLDLPPDLLSLIDDHQKISAAQADRFVKDWKEPHLQQTLKAAIAHFVNAPASASVVMRAMAESIAPANPPRIEPVMLPNGDEIGRVRRTKSGGFRIELDRLPAGTDQMSMSVAIANAVLSATK